MAGVIRCYMLVKYSHEMDERRFAYHAAELTGLRTPDYSPAKVTDFTTGT